MWSIIGDVKISCVDPFWFGSRNDYHVGCIFGGINEVSCARNWFFFGNVKCSIVIGFILIHVVGDQ